MTTQQRIDTVGGFTPNDGFVPTDGFAPDGEFTSGTEFAPSGGLTPNHAPLPPVQKQTDAFFNSVRRLGFARTPDRWIGGVAAGIAHRFGWDPMIVRGLFFISMFMGGFGFLLYGLAWALLPEASDGRIHLQEAIHGHFDPALIGAGLFALSGMTSSGSIFGWAISHGLGLIVGLGHLLFWGVAIYLFVNWIHARKRTRLAAAPMAGEAAIPALGDDAPFPAPAPTGLTTGTFSATTSMATSATSSANTATTKLPTAPPLGQTDGMSQSATSNQFQWQSESSQTMETLTMPLSNGKSSLTGANATAAFGSENDMATLIDSDSELDYILDDNDPLVSTVLPDSSPAEPVQPAATTDDFAATWEQTKAAAVKTAAALSAASTPNIQADYAGENKADAKATAKMQREHAKYQRAWERSQTPVVKGPGRPFTMAVLGVLLLLLAGGLLLEGMGQSLFGIGLLTLGVSSIIAGIRGRKSGFLGFLGVIGLIAALTTLSAPAIPSAPEWSDATTLTWTTPTDDQHTIMLGSNMALQPVSRAEVEAGYRVSFGDGTLDLTGLDFSGVTSANPIVVPVQVSFGNFNIIIPDDISVAMDPRVYFGNIDRQFGTQSDDALLVLMLEVRFGNITVTDDASVLVGSPDVDIDDNESVLVGSN